MGGGGSNQLRPALIWRTGLGSLRLPFGAHFFTGGPVFFRCHGAVLVRVRLVEHVERLCGHFGKRHLAILVGVGRSEEHTSELQSLMRISYAVFCLKKKRNNNN